MWNKMRRDHRTGKYRDVPSEIIFVPESGDAAKAGGGQGRGARPPGSGRGVSQEATRCRQSPGDGALPRDRDVGLACLLPRETSVDNQPPAGAPGSVTTCREGPGRGAHSPGHMPVAGGVSWEERGRCLGTRFPSIHTPHTQAQACTLPSTRTRTLTPTIHATHLHTGVHAPHMHTQTQLASAHPYLHTHVHTRCICSLLSTYTHFTCTQIYTHLYSHMYTRLGILTSLHIHPPTHTCTHMSTCQDRRPAVVSEEPGKSRWGLSAGVRRVGLGRLWRGPREAPKPLDVPVIGACLRSATRRV